MSSPATIAGKWKVDAPHSSATFSVHYIVGRYRAGFASFDATLDLTGDEPRLEGTVDVTSLTIGLDVFKQHMLGDEFFQADKYPELRFVSTSWKQNGNQVEVVGDLTLRGVTKSVTAKGTISEPIETLYTGPSIGLQLQADISRKDFDLNTWNPDLPGGKQALADNVTLDVDLAFLVADQG
jgi:polyisoprenoid-binding protein YceI